MGAAPDCAPDWLRGRAFAHRGLHDADAGRVENSLPAIRAALEAGYGVEVDVQISADDIAMVFHDETLDRLTGEKGLVRDRTAAELKAIPLTGMQTGLTTLAEALRFIDGAAPVIIDVKTRRQDEQALEDAVIRDLRAYDGPAAPMIWYADSFRHFREALDRPIGHIVPRRMGRKFWPPWYLFSPFPGDRPDFLATDIRYLPTIFTRRARHLGLPVLTWTVNTEARLRTARAYADGPIFEDIRPDPRIALH